MPTCLKTVYSRNIFMLSCMIYISTIWLHFCRSLIKSFRGGSEGSNEPPFLERILFIDIIVKYHIVTQLIACVFRVY